MNNRIKLHNILVKILESSNVYFQPPKSVQIKYPCIIYNRSDIKTDFADNNPYVYKTRYTITIIDSNPDSKIPEKIGMLPMCVFDRHYTSDNLNHDVYSLYF